MSFDRVVPMRKSGRERFGDEAEALRERAYRERLAESEIMRMRCGGCLGIEDKEVTAWVR